MTTETQAQSTQALAAEARAIPELGRSRLRKEDARLITGQTTWTDNLILPGMLHSRTCAARSRTPGSPGWT